MKKRFHLLLFLFTALIINHSQAQDSLSSSIGFSETLMGNKEPNPIIITHMDKLPADLSSS